jgi:predicted nucleic acid-binding Zn ribbon protein
MPFYDYKCEACEHLFEEMLKIKDHKKPEKKTLSKMWREKSKTNNFKCSKFCSRY